MATKRNGSLSKYLLLHNGSKLKKGYHNSRSEIWSAGSTVTYIINAAENKIQTAEVDYGASCLDFKPTLSGWEFVGWREDTVAAGDVLISKLMESDPITLYAVFKKSVALTYYVNGTPKSVEGIAYYNAAGISTFPTLAIENPTLSGATFKGWSVTDEDATVSYGSLAGGFQISANTTVYAVFKYDDVTFTPVTGWTNEGKESETNTMATFSNPNVISISVSISGLCRWDYWDWQTIKLNGTQIWSCGNINGDDTANGEWKNFSCSGTVNSNSVSVVHYDSNNGGGYGGVTGAIITATGVGKTIVG